jgi:hypothetical protein
MSANRKTVGTNGRKQRAARKRSSEPGGMRYGPTDRASGSLRQELTEYLQEDILMDEAVWPFSAVGEIQDYLAIRRKFTDGDKFTAHMTLGDPFELRLLTPEVEALGIPPERYLVISHNEVGDVLENIDWISLRLLELLSASPAGDASPVRRGKKPSDALIDYLVALMNESCATTTRCCPPRSLVYLTSLRLLGPRSAIRESLAFRRFAFDVGRVVEDLAMKNVPFTASSLAKAVGVPTSTLIRSLDRLVDVWNWEGMGLRLAERVHPENVRAYLMRNSRTKKRLQLLQPKGRAQQASD